MDYAAPQDALLDKALQMERSVYVSSGQVIAPFYLRCAAIFIDYILLLMPPVALLIFTKFFGEGHSSASISGSIWYLVLILWLIDFLALPLWSGQTLGKMLAGITMVKTDGSPLRLGDLAMRHTVGYLATALTLGLGFLIPVLAMNGRSLHDHIGRTIVVHGRRRRV